MTSPRLSILALAAALAGCSTLKVGTEFDPKAPFASYKTYAWIAPAPGPEQAPPIRDPRIREFAMQVVDREMARKGLVKTTLESNPDFLVSIIGWSKTEVSVSNYGYTYGGAYAYGPYYHGPVVAVPVTEVRQYTDGTMLLDFVDAKTKQLVWRGTATDAITSPESVRSSIDAATRKLLEHYPPKQ
jgi:hypothetical protein